MERPLEGAADILALRPDDLGLIGLEPRQAQPDVGAAGRARDGWRRGSRRSKGRGSGPTRRCRRAGAGRRRARARPARDLRLARCGGGRKSVVSSPLRKGVPSSEGKDQDPAKACMHAAPSRRCPGRLRPTVTPQAWAILRSSALRPSPRPGRRKLAGLGRRRPLAELDEHFMLVDHVVEFEADPVGAGPGDARGHRASRRARRRPRCRPAAPAAFDQRALPREIAQARVDLAGIASPAWPPAARARAWPSACRRPRRCAKFSAPMSSFQPGSVRNP